MRSCLYECTVLHHRFSPREHGFAYRIFLLALDLDELDTLHRGLRLFSRNRRNLYSFRDADYLPTGERVHNPSTTPADGPGGGARDLKARVVGHLARNGIDLAGGRVLLVTLPRVAGYLFNPVSFYFCFDRDGRAAAALAEVTNTFREMKPFLLGPDTRGDSGSAVEFAHRAPKHFYVSPFSDTSVAFDFRLRVPGERLGVHIDDYENGARTLASFLTGRRRPLTDGSLAGCTLKYPFITLQVIALIHWHALRLYLKKVPWFAKAARATEQRDLYRPHASIVHSTDS